MSYSASQETKPAIQPPTGAYRDEEERLEVVPGMSQNIVWALKIPKFLLERWEQVEEAGVELGTLVVDSSVVPPKVTLKLPSAGPDESRGESSKRGAEVEEKPSKRARYNMSNLPDEYEVPKHADHARTTNTYIFTEKVKKWGATGSGLGGPSRHRREKAEPKLLAQVAHEFTMQPVQNENYLRILRQRQLESQQTRRPIMQMEDQGYTQGQLNQMASGYSNTNSKFGQGLVAQAKKRTGEKNDRLERTELTDRLFGLFSEKPYWSIVTLRKTLKQPDAWLREVLKDLAEQVQSGEYLHMWKLKDSWKRTDVKPDPQGKAGTSDVKGEVDSEAEDEEDEDDEDDDDDDDEDLEEVLHDIQEQA